MANTEKKSVGSAAEQSPAQASLPSDVVNAPAANETVNKANPNMVMGLVLSFIVIIGFVLAFLFNGNFGLSEDMDASEASEKEKLQRMIDAEMSGASADSRASEVALEGRIASILDNTYKIQSEFETIRESYKDAKEKTQQMENQVRGNMNTISMLGSQNTALSNENAKLRTLAANAQAYQNQAQLLANSNAEKDALIATLQNRPSDKSVQQLRENLAREQKVKADLMLNIQDLERQVKSAVDSKDEARTAELLAQNEDLRRRLQALQTSMDFAKLFVKTHTTLPENAQALYNELKKLEGYSEEKLRAAYTKIAADLNAENLQQMKFATGSSILSSTDQMMIKAKLDATEATDYFLVVGYASQTGAAANNETLSANRATAVASIVNQLKKDGQDVRAVFLGQTNRFSKSVNADNQLCEIWRIKE